MPPAVFRFFFAPEHSAWWTGAVYSNLIASAICLVISVAWGLRKWRAHEAAKDARDQARHDALHARLDLHEAQRHELHAVTHDRLDAHHVYLQDVQRTLHRLHDFLGIEDDDDEPKTTVLPRE